MRALLDVNLLVALFSPSHVGFREAHEWLVSNRTAGWASCPMTVNGFVRIVTNPNAGLQIRVEEALRRLQSFCEASDHQFWATGVSLLDESLFRPAYLAGPKQIADVYLLGLAVRNGGRLATFDRRIPLNAVAGAKPHHLEVLGRV